MSVQLVSAKCPSCGGEVSLPANLSVAHCIYCGTKIIINNPNADSQRANIDNWLKLADGIRESNPSQAYGYYSKVLEYDPENYLAWLGKGRIATVVSTFADNRLNEMMDCFTRVKQYMPKDISEDKKQELSDWISLSMLSFAVEFYKQITIDYLQNSSGDCITRFWNRLEVVFGLIDLILENLKFEGVKDTLEIALKLCKQITENRNTRRILVRYGKKLKAKHKEYEKKMQEFDPHFSDSWPWYA